MATQSSRLVPVEPSHAVRRPFSLSEVTITSGVLREAQDRVPSIVKAVYEQLEAQGYLANFDLIARGEAGARRSGPPYTDSEAYKLLEAIAWHQAVRPAPELEPIYADIVSRIAAAQDPDGYLHTGYGHAGQPARFSDLEWGHEFYCWGHLLQAAVVRIRGGHDDGLTQVAARTAEFLLAAMWAPSGSVRLDGHPEVELALAEYGRATGDRRFVEAAAALVDARGSRTLDGSLFGSGYFLDDVPVREAQVLRGHAVRALYLSAGALDVASETDDTELAAAVARAWDRTQSRRTFITGGLGSRYRDEAIGLDDEVSSDRAYAETCAGIASAMVTWRLYLNSGSTRRADAWERVFYNNILTSPSDDGRRFLYTNTLHQRAWRHPEDHTSPESDWPRAARTASSCCASNIARTFASLPGYLAATSSRSIEILQFGRYSIHGLAADGSEVGVTVTSNYPIDGTITVSIDLATTLDVELRLPSWVSDIDTVRCPGGTIDIERGVISFSGPFDAGREVRVDLPIRAGYVRAAARIDDLRQQAAIQRGPVLLALESADLPEGVDIEDVRLLTDQQPETTPEGARVRITTLVDERDQQPLDWAYFPLKAPAGRPGGQFEINLLPYHRWGRRGLGGMRVWIPHLS